MIADKSVAMHPSGYQSFKYLTIHNSSPIVNRNDNLKLARN
jgi:hypothetical protein